MVFLITDQTAIIYHEYYHLTYDNPKRTDWRTYNKDLPEILYMVPTDEIMKYYTDRWYKDYELYFKYRYIKFGKDFNDYLKDYFLQVTVICHPSYYLNEINAYEAEMRMFPNLTGQYNETRLFKLWEHQQMYDISIEYYEKKYLL